MARASSWTMSSGCRCLGRSLDGRRLNDRTVDEQLARLDITQP